MTIPVLDPYYRVEVDAGPYSWVTEKDDPADYGLADPLRVGWSLPGNNPLFHAQPDPMTASFSVIVAEMADVAGLGRGDTVAIRVYGWPPGTDNPHAEAGDLDPVDYPPIVIFRGRITEPVAIPHKLGMIVTYACADYSVDLAEATIGAGDWPAETNNERLPRMFSEAGVLAPAEFSPGVYFLNSFGLIARPGSPSDARSLIWQLADWSTGDPEAPFDVYHYLTTNYAAGFLDGDEPDPLEPYAVPFANTRLESGDTGEAPRLPGIFAKTVPGVELIANSGFETNVAGYSGSNANLARSLVWARTGVASMSLTAIAAANMLAVDSGSGVGGIPVTAGVPVKVEGWVRAATVSRSVQFRMDWWTAAGAFISTSLGTAVADSTSADTYIREWFVPPPTAARARRQLVVLSPAAGEVHRIDDWTLTQGTKWGVDIVEDAGRRAAIINADHVDFKAVWAQTKRTDPDTVTLTGAFIDTDTGLTHNAVTVTAPDPVPIAASIPMDANNTDSAEDFGRANLADSAPDRWTADIFTWYADQDPWPMIADGLWFIEGLHVLASRAPVVIDGIDPTKHPAGLDWYAGRLRSATFTLARGRYNVQLQLQRSLLRPQVFHTSLPGEGVGTLSWEDLAADPTIDGLRWEELDPAFTWFDARLLRSP